MSWFCVLEINDVPHNNFYTQAGNRNEMMEEHKGKYMRWIVFWCLPIESQSNDKLGDRIDLSKSTNLVQKGDNK